MYSSIQKIDIAARSPDGPVYVQTDHRSCDEVESEPELSTLFALARLILARAHATKQGETNAAVVYASIDAHPPAFLVEAIASTGAQLSRGPDKAAPLAKVAVTPAELADKAFRGLAAKCCARTGSTDPAIALAAIEAETMADVPDLEEDEITYWTRILELAALTGEVIRAKHQGAWDTLSDTKLADVPFAYKLAGGELMLPTNRAGRFIDDGPAESMFHMIDSANEPRERDNLPVLPSLRTRGEAVAQNMTFRPLLSDAAGDDIPVIAYGTDSPTQFGLITGKANEDVDALHAKAIANLIAQQVQVEEISGELLVVTDNFFATEKLLDEAFMQSLQQRLKAKLLAVTVPRRGLMFVMDGMPRDPQRGMAILAGLTAKEGGTSRRISSAILLVQDGKVVGRAKLEGGEDAPPEPPPTKRPGFFRRLFGGGGKA